MYSYKLNIPAEVHDEFAQSHPQANLLQSSSWTKIKDNWKSQRVAFYKDDEIVGVASILIQSLPLGFTIFYIPRGPIFDYENTDLLHYIVQTLKKLGKQSRALFVKFDPTIIYRIHSDQAAKTPNQHALDIIKNLQDAGADWTGLTTDLAANIQPRYQANIYAHQFHFDDLSKTMKRKIKTARQKGVEIVIGGSELVEEFARVMKKTEDRKQINLRSADYYQKLIDTYPEHSFIAVARFHIANRLTAIQEELAKLKDAETKFTEKTKEAKRLENSKAQERLTEEFIWLQDKYEKENRPDYIPIAGTLNLQFGQVSDNLYAGTDTEYGQYQGSVLVWYETVDYLFKSGYRSQNMGGLENTLDGGLYKFKIQFLPTVEELIGEFNLPTSPFYNLFNLAYKLRKKMRTKHS
ncbi:peptidoglycan bridge formation glycyltransferase FemA/FemB family protein [Streptococcus himalayensis]|uniref:UDP-N-acetylmuramoylpentapeptide-lysine N(6)-alanyltransferase n=1 Tax=Streptococcus himalayensis TaxID=1888195 RepID=A0A917EEI7_9STRE|nr:peptidoglycan bridge formation glycyltransferase FemA/FemB family protein [Streptococcus himalayensis]GGE32028.1 UDP-N-acetylmuramoylpentapeptide-lysine N(6)-alanyltransferase [Streptococcus himalayensis]